MPYYIYECKQGHKTEKFLRIAQLKNTTKCPECSKRSYLTIPARQYARTFKPYIEENFDGKPIEITSSEQRDKLCKIHGVTYDSYKTHVKYAPKSSVDEVTLQEVTHAAKTGQLPSGEKLEGFAPAVSDLDT